MIRDLERSPEINPTDRREFLQRLALRLSQRGYPTATSDLLKDLISKQFKLQLARLAPEARAAQLERYFADLRSSATLTRDLGQAEEGWRFSHNSLREYLVAEHFISKIESDELVADDVPISDAMRTFVASKDKDEIARLLRSLSQLWNRSGSAHGKGAMLSFLWEGIIAAFSEASDPRHDALVAITGRPISLANSALNRLTLSTDDSPTDLADASFAHSSLQAVDLSGADLRHTDFSNSVLEAVRFTRAHLTGARSVKSLLVDVDVWVRNLREPISGGLLRHHFHTRRESQASDSTGDLEGPAALGYLRFHGALTMDIPAIHVVCNDPRFGIVEKILRKIERAGSAPTARAGPARCRTYRCCLCAQVC